MGNTTILQLPQATGLTGTEQIEGVQANTSVRIPLNLIAALGPGPPGPVGPVGPAVPFLIITPAENAAGVNPAALNPTSYFLYQENDIRRYAPTFGTSDGTTWDNCRAVATQNGRPMVLAGLALTFSAGIFWDYAAHGIEGGNATLNFPAMTAGTALTVDTVGQYLQSNPTPFRDFTLIGPGSSSVGVFGIQFGTSGGSHFGAYASIDNFYIRSFDHGVTFGSNSWQHSIGSGLIQICNWGVFYPPGISNSGECINFGHVSITNCANGVYCNGGQLNFQGASFDYNTSKHIYCQNGGQVRVAQYHIESNLDNDYWLLCQDADSLIELVQGDVTNTGTNKKTFPVGQCNNSGGAQINFGSLTITGFTEANYGFNYLIDGHGSVSNVSYLNQVNSGGTTAAVPFSSGNLLVDGGFEQSSIVDWLATGNGAQASISTAQHFSGAQSMMQAPAAGQTSVEVYYATVQPGCSVQFASRLIFTGPASTDNASIQIAFLDENGNTLALNQINRLIANLPTTWTRYVTCPFGQAPSGSRYVRVIVAKQSSAGGNSDGNGAFFWDDFYVFVTGGATAPLAIVEYPPTNRLAMTAAFATSPPKGVAISGIRIVNTTANAVTGGLNVGSTPGGSDALAALAVGANAEIYLRESDLLKSYFPSTGHQVYNFSAGSSFNGASLNITIFLRRILTQGF